MKVNPKVKAFCYICMNVGIVVWSAVSFLQGTPAQRTLLVLIVTLVIVNFMLWFLFRARDNGGL
jgi:hypothetical protein